MFGVPKFCLSIFFIVTKHFFDFNQKQIHLKNHVPFFCSKKKANSASQKPARRVKPALRRRAVCLRRTTNKKHPTSRVFIVCSAGARLGFCDFLLDGPEIEGVKSKQFFFGGVSGDNWSNCKIMGDMNYIIIFYTGSFLAKNQFSEASLLLPLRKSRGKPTHQT